MKQKLLNSLRLRVCALVAVIAFLGAGQAWGDTTTTYTFSSASWEASPANWTSGQAGGGFTTGQGVQVMAKNDGANATSPKSFTNVSKIVVTYCTNSKNGVGEIKVQVGSGTEQSFSVTKPSSGGNTLKTTEFTFSPNETGNVKITVNCTANSIYIYSIAITEASSGPSQLDAPELTATASNNAVTLEWDAISNASSYTIQYADNASFTGATTVANATSPKEISGLTNGTTYYFKAMTVGDGTNYLSSDYGDAVSATPANVSRITITQDELTDFTNTYGWYDWTAGGVSGSAYAYKASGMQFNSGKDGYWVYNTSAIPGTITSVKMVKASGTDRDWTLRAGTSEISTTDGGTLIGSAQTVGTSGTTWAVEGTYNYFCLIVSGGATVISSIEITYIPSTDPIIVASDPSELAYNATSGEFGYSITNPTSATLGATSNAAWITNVAVDGTNSKVTFNTSTNPNTTQRTGTITLSYTGATEKVITISQAAAPAPSISVDDVEIAYNAESGSIAYTLVNGTGNVTAVVTTGDWLTLGTINTSAVPFTCSANTGAAARTATVTFSFSGADDKVVTVTQAGNPNVVNNISDITAVNTSYKVRGTVVATNSRGFVIGDGTGYVYTYLNAAPTQSVNDKVTIDGTTGSYGHILQFTSSATIETAASSNYDNTPAIIIVDATAISGYNSDYQLSDYVQFEGELTTSTSNNNTYYNIAVGTATARISYPTTAQVSALDALLNKTVRVKGYFAGFSSSTFTVMMESVEEVTTPIINADDVEIEYDATSGEIAYTISNGTSATLGATTTADWISNIAVTADKVTFTATVNEGTTDRTATFTLTYSGATNKTVTVTQKHYVVDYATLPFSYDGDARTNNLVEGLTQSGITDKYNTSPKIKFDTTDDYLILKLNEAPGVLSFDIKGMGTGTWSGTFDVLTSANGVDYNNTLQSYTSLSSSVSREVFTLDSSVRYIKWVFTSKTTGFNVALGNIVVEKPSVTLNGSGYATYTSNSAINYSDDSEFSAWAITSIDDTSINFSQITGSVPAGTGVLLKGTAGQVVTPIATTSGTAPESNLLVGIATATEISANTYYGLSGENFVKVNSGTVKAGKALLPASYVDGTNVKSFTFVFEGADGIVTVENGQLTMDNDQIFNLAGQRMSKPVKGVNIINGKKVLVK